MDLEFPGAKWCSSFWDIPEYLGRAPYSLRKMYLWLQRLLNSLSNMTRKNIPQNRIEASCMLFQDNLISSLGRPKTGLTIHWRMIVLSNFNGKRHNKHLLCHAFKTVRYLWITKCKVCFVKSHSSFFTYDSVEAEMRVDQQSIHWPWFQIASSPLLQRQPFYLKGCQV